jgi:hypothetical protein
VIRGRGETSQDYFLLYFPTRNAIIQIPHKIFIFQPLHFSIDILESICNNWVSPKTKTTRRLLMDLNSFIDNAISEVRKAKKTGKAGKDARKSLNRKARDGQAKVEALKAEIKAIAAACERKEWKETALVMYKMGGTCKSCGHEKQTCFGSIHLEKTHRKLGKIITRIEQASVAAYPSLPRRIEALPDTDYICEDCFLSFNVQQPDLFEPAGFDCRSTPDKQIALFKAEEKRWQDKCWRALLPKPLKLLPSPETFQ